MTAAVTPFFEYNGAVWATIFATLSYLNTQLQAVPTPATAASLVQTTLQSVLNGLETVGASDYVSAWLSEVAALKAVQALPFSTDAGSLAVLNARVVAIQSAATNLNGLLPSVSTFLRPSLGLSQGAPTIPALGIYNFYNTFSFETPPSGATGITMTDALTVNTALNNVASAVLVVQGANPTQAYDTAVRQANIAQTVASMIGNLTSSPIVTGSPPFDLTTLWNVNVTVPSLMIDAAIVNAAPYLLSFQQSCVMRYAMLTIIGQLALFLLILRRPQTSTVRLAQLRNSETLMDVAARTLNNFEQWQAIAAANSLAPPYIAPNPGPNVAIPGSQLLLPTQGSQPSSLGSAPSYANNFLGTDLYLGPINGQMPSWSGQFQTISGYNNLAISLGRRLQTTLGTLIYHSDYGSLIPPEVGNVASENEAVKIASFGKSALLSDPRVVAVLQAIATGGPNFSINFQGVVQPAGFGTQTISVNEVINPLP